LKKLIDQEDELKKEAYSVGNEKVSKTLSKLRSWQADLERIEVRFVFM